MLILSYLFFTAFIIYLIVGVYTLRLNQKSDLNKIFFILSLSFAFWSFDNVLFHILKDKKTIIILHNIFAFNWCFFQGIILHFFLILTNKKKLLQKWWLYLILYLPGAVFYIKELNGNLLVKDFVLSNFGWKAIYYLDSPWYWAYNVYFIFFLSSCVVLTWLWGKYSSNIREKRLSRIILYSGIITFLMGYIFDLLMPQLNIRFLPPLSTFFILIWFISIWLSIVKYRLMNFTPAIIIQEVMSGMLDILVLVDYEGSIILVNKQMEKIIGYPENELMGKNLTNYIVEKESIRNMIDKIKNRTPYNWSLEVNLISKLQDILPVLFTSFVVSNDKIGLTGILFLGQDKRQENLLKKEMEDRKKVELALKESEEQFKMLVENTAASIFIFQDEKIIYVNASLEKLSGYTREEISQKRIFDFIHPDYYNMIKDIINKRAKENIPSFRYELKWINKEGEARWIDLTTSTIYYEGRKAILGSGFDITEQKKIADQLRNLYSAVEQSSALVVVIDTAGHIEYVNQKFIEVTGFDPNAEKNNNIFNLDIDNAVKENLYKIFDMLIGGHDYRGELSVTIENDKKIWLYFSASPIKNAQGKITNYVGVAEDITNKKIIEEEMLKINKLDSLEVLAGGIGHDLNNILTAIIGNISLAKLNIQPVGPVYEFLSEAEKASLRARNLSWQFLTFSKGSITYKKSIILGEVIRETVKFTINNKNVVCKFYIPNDLWEVEADEVQICQVIENLVINACQAMPDGGEIIITAENLKLEENNQSIPLISGNYVKLTFRDNGHGIPTENLQKIFDPYFTTKDIGHGLGLTICYSIIKKHNGYIGVDSIVGKGSAFYLYLPSTKKDNQVS